MLIIVHHLILIISRKFFLFGEGTSDDINGSIDEEKKTFSINFNKTKINFCWSLHCSGDNSYFFVNRKEIYEIKADKKNVNKTIHFS